MDPDPVDERPPEQQRWWWRYEHFECPVCGRGPTERTRVFTEAERGHVFIHEYDHCLEWEAIFFG